jgi:hypothetical protein
MDAVKAFIQGCRAGAAAGIDLVRFLGLSLRSRTALAAEILFLRKQLALYRERRVQPHRASGPCCSRWPAGPVLRLAGGAHDRPAGDAPPVAPRGVPPPLALAGPSRPAAPSSGPPQRLIAALARDNPSWGGMPVDCQGQPDHIKLPCSDNPDFDYRISHHNAVRSGNREPQLAPVLDPVRTAKDAVRSLCLTSRN